MMNRTIIISAGVLIVSSLAILIFNGSPVILIMLLVALAAAKHRIIPIKKELSWFLITCLGGAAVEIALVNFGRAWTYAYPQFFGIPLYMPVFWGLAGTTTISLYQGIAGR